MRNGSGVVVDTNHKHKMVILGGFMNPFCVLFSSSSTSRLLAAVMIAGFFLSGCGGSGGGGGGDNNSGNPPANQPPCAPGTIGSGGVCVDQKFIFVSSQTVAGNFGSLVAADNLCASYATNAGLGGTWKAWLSDELNDAINRIVDVGPWYMVGTSTIVVNEKSELGTSQSGLIDRTEYGDQITGSFSAWSGSYSNGYRHIGYTCNNWTGTGTDPGGRLVNMSAGVPWGTDNPYYYRMCGFGDRLVCIEQ